MKFVASSHVSYHSKTFDSFVRSMLESGVPKDDLYFFVGGGDAYEPIENSHGVHAYHAPHNSVDFTGIVSVLDLDLEADYWFALHDTTRAGPNFYERVSRATPAGDAVALTADGPSMNMGAYAWPYLKSRRDEILTRFKNVDYSPEGTQRIKKLNVDTEDALLTGEAAFNGSGRVTTGPADHYGTGTPRIVEYFPDVDLYKMKANWACRDAYAVAA
jgi:hypothetical protein